MWVNLNIVIVISLALHFHHNIEIDQKSRKKCDPRLFMILFDTLYGHFMSFSTIIGKPFNTIDPGSRQSVSMMWSLAVPVSLPVEETTINDHSDYDDAMIIRWWLRAISHRAWWGPIARSLFGRKIPDLTNNRWSGIKSLAKTSFCRLFTNKINGRDSPRP